MAQLYKMTLYVCDLEDSLSLDEIKTLIEQDALNGISVNCICHFADSKIGQNVEWNDDIDLNRCDCPTSAWEKYFAPPTKEKTNADVTAQEWISVKDRLPEYSNDGFADAVLVTDGFVQHMAYFVGGEWRFAESGEIKEPMWYRITHWMPLPQPPKGE